MNLPAWVLAIFLGIAAAVPVGVYFTVTLFSRRTNSSPIPVTGCMRRQDLSRARDFPFLQLALASIG